MADLRESGEDFSEALVRRSVWGGEKLVNLLIDECGCEKDLGVGKSPSGNPSMIFTDEYESEYKRPDTSCGPGGFGSYIVNNMKNLADKYGVVIRTATEVDHILLNKDGNVCGAKAHDAGGQIEVRCRACVMATGSFSHNREIMEHVNPAIYRPGAPIHLYAAPTCTGDGIRMVEEIGGAIDYVNMKANNFGPVHHPFGFALVCTSWSPKAIMINKDGVRFCAEDDRGDSQKFFDQPGQYAYAIVDSRLMKETMADMIAQKRDGKYGVMIFEHIEDEIRMETKPGGPTKIGNTWGELAEKLGIAPEILEMQMARYNASCDAGVDEEFGRRKEHLVAFREPPYYAIYMGRFQENAMGGAKINDETGVIRENGEAIPGLYAVGDNCRGVQFKNDHSTLIMDRMIPAMTWSVTSGVIAGDAVTAYLGSQKP
jgi:fumarate reductase flavoprotein subunit